MCFYNGIEVSRAKHIQLKDKSKKIADYDLNLHMPMASGFEYPLWPVLKPVDGGFDFIPTMMHWEFIPSYIKNQQELLHFRKGGMNPKTGKKDFPHNTLNAIGEEIFNKPTYKKAAVQQRCLVLSSWFYEWRHFTPPGQKDQAYPYSISVIGKEYFYMAGIYNSWVDQETGEIMDSFAILTTAANPLMAKIHNKKKRMPVVLTDHEAYEWIQHDADLKRIQELACYSFPDDQLEAFTIRKDFRLIENPREKFLYEELPKL